MKCNKCLKKIPKGENIKFTTRKYSGSSHYGGNYCESCWKNSDKYKWFEDGGKQPQSSSSNSKVPWWGWLIIGIVVGMIAIGSLWWLSKDSKEREYE